MRRLAVWFTVVLTAAALGCATLGINPFKQPVVTLKNVSVRELGLTGGSLDIVMDVYNPNGYQLDGTRMTYKLMVDTVPFGSGAIDSSFRVQKNDSTQVTLPLNFSWAGVGSLGRQLLSTGTVNYRVLGDITVGTAVGNFTVPYDRSGRFSTLGGTR
jgi:LEA14-like dessication related protein